MQNLTLKMLGTSLLAVSALLAGTAARRRRRRPTARARRTRRVSRESGLRRVPHRAARHAVRRRPEDGHADGRDLYDQHHARSGDGHRRLYRSRLRQRVAQGCREGRSQPVSGDAVPVVREAEGRRREGAVRVFHARRRAGEAGEPAVGHPWPLNMRWPLALWNKVFLDTTPYADKPSRDVVWNRGAYLVQAGHCGSCHAARRRLPGEGARRRRRGVPVGRRSTTGSRRT